jgi:hypothetical protein
MSKEPTMLIEMRSYDFAPGKALAYAELFRREGLPPITRHLPLVGYFMTEIGVLNRLHHLWVYESLAERAARRGGFMQDKAWTEGFLPRGLALVQRQESRLLRQIVASDALAAAIATAGQTIPAEPAEAPLFGDGLFGFATGGAPADPALVGLWRVVAGPDAGSEIALHRLDAALSRPDAAASAPVDLCRPLRFSPLS